ncbi:cilia- and flagella-associated protein 251-like [Harpegnathos saltator]|uniref:cilia- and flagella-associated protein 251-like n=1 Tax=Harpegnathos saltator TaxID=610380 RepID=UPI000DBEDB9F|nr:cilia- and flagella-associated protein 251-like [Harpegnathos saltator]
MDKKNKDDCTSTLCDVTQRGRWSSVNRKVCDGKICVRSTRRKNPKERMGMEEGKSERPRERDKEKEKGRRGERERESSLPGNAFNSKTLIRSGGITGDGEQLVPLEEEEEKNNNNNKNKNEEENKGRGEREGEEAKEEEEEEEEDDNDDDDDDDDGDDDEWRGKKERKKKQYDPLTRKKTGSWTSEGRKAQRRTRTMLRYAHASEAVSSNEE